MENNDRYNGQGSLPFLKGGRKHNLRTDFAQAFCTRCRQLRSLLECSTEDIERCIVVYYMDFSTFVHKIVIPTMRSFCIESCTSYASNHCTPWEDIRVPLRCLISIKTKILRDEINKHMTRSKNNLLIKACERNIHDIFGSQLAGIEDDSFELLADMFDGSIGKLTEDAAFHYINNKRVDLPNMDMVCAYGHAIKKHTDTTIPKKEFFFKEKL